MSLWSFLSSLFSPLPKGALPDSRKNLVRVVLPGEMSWAERLPGGRFRSLNNTFADVPLARGAYARLPAGARPGRKVAKANLIWGHIFEAKVLTKIGGRLVRKGEFVEPIEIVGFDGTPAEP